MKLNYKIIHKEILSWLDMEEYGITGEVSAHLRAFMNEFNSIANYPYNLQRFPNETDRLADYLQGLPSGFHFPFSNYDILQTSIRWGSLPIDYKEKQADKILENWFKFIAWQLIKIDKKGA